MNTQPIMYMLLRPIRSDRCPANGTQRNPRIGRAMTAVSRKSREHAAALSVP